MISFFGRQLVQACRIFKNVIMKPILRLTVCFLLSVLIVLASCNKESPVSTIASPTLTNDQRLMPFGTLSIARQYVCAATVGSKILFAGGATQTQPSLIASSRVDIYDTLTQKWSTAELSMPRAGLIATSLGNKI